MKYSLFCIVIFIVFMVGIRYNVAEELVCQPDTVYIVNNCMSCTCQEKGTYICPLANCFDPKERCADVKNPYVDDCNKCWCVKGKGTFCTSNKC